MTDVSRDTLPDARRPRPMPPWKIEFYRQSRLWHGYLSAFAFIALIFFSVTGLLLNHPEWLKREDARPQETRFILPASGMAAALGWITFRRPMGKVRTFSASQKAWPFSMDFQVAATSRSSSENSALSTRLA